MSFVIMKDKKYKDKAGDTVWFPKDDKPYFDTAMRRTFGSVKEKAEFMNKHGIVSSGDSDSKVKQERSRHEEEKRQKESRR